MADKLPSGVRRRGKKYTALPYINGKHEWGGTFDTVEEADERVKEMRDAAPPKPSRKEPMSVTGARWLKDREHDLEGSTHQTYAYAVAAFNREFGDREARTISKQDAMRWAKKNTHYAIVIRTMFKELAAEDVVAKSPLESFEVKMSRGRRDLVIPTDEEFDLLLDCCAVFKGEFRATMEAFVVGMGDEGWRTSEAFGLDWSNLDLEAMEVEVADQVYKRQRKRTKGKNRRVIAMSDRFAERAQRLTRYIGEDAVFLGKGHTRLTAGALSPAWAVLRTRWEAKLDPRRVEAMRESRPPSNREFVPYELRHYCASRMMEEFALRGEDGAPAVAHHLGHTDGGKLVKELYGRHFDKQVFTDRVRRVMIARQASGIEESQERSVVGA